MRRVHDGTQIRFVKMGKLLAAAGAVVILVPEAIHGGAEEAKPKKHRHHASNKGSKTWFRLDGGERGVGAEGAWERCRRIPVECLSQRDSLWIIEYGVGWDYPFLVRVLLLLISRVWYSHHRFFFTILLPHSPLFTSTSDLDSIQLVPRDASLILFNLSDLAEGCLLLFLCPSQSRLPFTFPHAFSFPLLLPFNFSFHLLLVLYPTSFT